MYKRLAKILPIIAVLVLPLVAINLLYVKPSLEYLDYQLKHDTAATKLFRKALYGTPEDLVRLEQMTHEDSSLANAMVRNVYRREAIKVSGVQLEDPNADLSKIDTQKIDGLVLQAMREYSDLELMAVLGQVREVWDSRLPTALSISPYVDNALKISAMSTFSAEQKAEIESCYEKLQDKFSNPLWILANMRSIGTCSQYRGDSGELLELAVSGFPDQGE
jgi:hypothetical protein